MPSGVVAVPTRRRIPSTVRISPSRLFPSGEDMLNCHVVRARNAPQGPAAERPHASVDVNARQQRSRYNEHSLGNGGNAPSNGSRLSCGAELEASQGEFYHTARKTFSGSIGEGRRQLQALVRLRTTSHSSGPSSPGIQSGTQRRLSPMEV